jgi:NAD(P)-dependent dehydrogenase (short-subunit alcohol dehydrogenase family)
MGILEGRVAIITGAARGLGRSHALGLAREGASIVVNDVGVSLAGDDAGSEGPAAEVVREIEAMGGKAIINGADVSDWEASGELIQSAVDAFGDLHILVNNAGIVRDRMFMNATEDEFDAVTKVHLKGHFCTARHAAKYWRDQAKAGGKVTGRIINTSSGAGLQGSIAQAVYSAAKAGIAALTLVQAAELSRYGITSNAIAPSARTRMTEEAFAEMMKKPEDGFDTMDPDNVAPLIAYLGSEDAADVTGRVFEIAGGMVSVCDGWRTGPSRDKGARWEAGELGDVIRELIQEGEAPQKVHGS